MPASDSKWGCWYSDLTTYLRSEKFRKFFLSGVPSQLSFWTMLLGLVEFVGVHYLLASWVAFAAYVLVNTYFVRCWAYQQAVFWSRSTGKYMLTHMSNQVWGSGVLYLGVDVLGFWYISVQVFLVVAYFVVNAYVAHRQFR